jgi:hypothetical protein
MKYCVTLSVVISVTLATRTLIGKQRKSSGQNTPHEQISCKRTGGEHEVRVNQVTEGALKDRGEAETNAGTSNAKSMWIDVSWDASEVFMNIGRTRSNGFPCRMSSP